MSSYLLQMTVAFNFCYTGNGSSVSNTYRTTIFISICKMNLNETNFNFQLIFFNSNIDIQRFSQLCLFVSPVGDAAIDQLREEKEFAEGQVQLFCSIIGFWF